VHFTGIYVPSSIFLFLNHYKRNKFQNKLKGKVSLDWEGLQMVTLDKARSISGSHLFFILIPFSDYFPMYISQEKDLKFCNYITFHGFTTALGEIY
jgi:hypothetical protein